jgi:antitoxin VapB
MPFHIRDAETDTVVRELAARRGIGITEAVREAVKEALAKDEQSLSLWERTADIRERIARYPDTGEKADKAFFDDLWGQGDE